MRKGYYGTMTGQQTTPPDNMASSADSMETRLIELETRSAFQEKVLDDLNEALVAQQRQLDQLEQTVDTALRRLRDLSADSDDTPA